MAGNYLVLGEQTNIRDTSEQIDLVADADVTLISLRANETQTSALLKIKNDSDSTLLSLTGSGGVLSASPSAGIGYTTGAGGAVTQATSKSTGVTVNAICGAITTNNAALAAAAEVGFTVTNSAVAATDVVVCSIKSGASADSYCVTVDAVAAGSFRISLSNVSAGSLSEAVVINFAVIKAVAA